MTQTNSHSLNRHSKRLTQGARGRQDECTEELARPGSEGRVVSGGSLARHQAGICELRARYARNDR